MDRARKGAAKLTAAAAFLAVATCVPRPAGASPGSRAASASLASAGVHRKANGRYVKRLCPRCQAFYLLPLDWRPGMAVPDRPLPQTGVHAMGPSDVQAAYAIPSSSAANGKAVAILDQPDTHAFADLSAYRAMFSLPALQPCSKVPFGASPCFAQVDETGGASQGADSGEGPDGETSLDMAMISAACPDCSILLIEVRPTLCETDFTTAVATARSLGASAVSISYGDPEATDPDFSLFDAGSFDAATYPCQSEVGWTTDLAGPFSSPRLPVFASSGDFAYDSRSSPLANAGPPAADSPNWPASSPYVIAVGGTSLYFEGSSYGEGVWDDGKYGLGTGMGVKDATTSGCSTEFLMPPWQANVLAGSGCTHRATADVAAAATFFYGDENVGIENVVNGFASGGYEGTSASAPLVAAIFTRLGLTVEASSDLGWLYQPQTMAAFNDVGSVSYPLPLGASSSNAPSGACGILCTVGAGWDGPSGVGSPNGARLADLPASMTVAPYPDAGPVLSKASDGGEPRDAGVYDATLAGNGPRDVGGESARDGGCSVGTGCESSSRFHGSVLILAFVAFRGRRLRRPRRGRGCPSLPPRRFAGTLGAFGARGSRERPLRDGCLRGGAPAEG